MFRDRSRGKSDYRLIMAPTTVVRGSRVAVGYALALIAITGCGSTPETAATIPPSSEPLSSMPVPTTGIPDREPHTLVLNATGGAAVTSIKYTLDGELMQEGPVTLPWRKSLSVPADGLPHSWTLEVEFSGTGSGELELFAIYDGEVTARSGGGASGTGGTQVSGSSAIGGGVRG